MKQSIYWLLVIAFTFMLGVAAALLYLEFTFPVTQKTEISSSLLSNEINDENISSLIAANLPILAYCELANNPQKYDGKIVRLSAKLYQNMHGLKFLDANCYSEEKETAVLFNDKRETEIVDKIAQETQTEKFIYWDEPTMIVIGKFKRVKPTRKSDSMEDNTDLHFEILEVEKASKR